MRAAREHRQSLSRRAPADDRAARASGFHECDAGRAGEEAPKRRGEHDAKRWSAVFDERDVDGEFAIAPDKLFRAVQRIDEPEARVSVRLRTFFGNHRDIRSHGLERTHDELVRSLIRIRDGRCIVLRADAEAALIDLEHSLPGAPRDRHDLLEQLDLHPHPVRPSIDKIRPTA